MFFRKINLIFSFTFIVLFALAGSAESRAHVEGGTSFKEVDKMGGEVPPWEGMTGFERYAHTNLTAKLRLLRVHVDRMQKQQEALVRFTGDLNDRQRGDIPLSAEDVVDALEKCSLPANQQFLNDLEKLESFLLVGRVNYCRFLIENKNYEALFNYFILIENEIESDIECYKLCGLHLPQYRYIVDFHRESRKKFPGLFGVIQRMFPEVLN